MNSIKKYKITVVGLGYVGLSISTLLSQKHIVTALDKDLERIKLINNKQSPIKDELIQSYLSEKNLDLRPTDDKNSAYKDADFIIISTPTDYDPDTNYFDTSSIESVIKDSLNFNKRANIIIKSTIPLGYTEHIKEVLNYPNIFYSPEFLREGSALYDNLHPSRIIVGGHTESAKVFASLLAEAAEKKHVDIIFCSSTEAEATKLFSNTFLAMRVAFFNELDSYCESHDLDTNNVIKGVCLDPRIGNFYNNPSFGYGGYCLPKDTKQLLSNYGSIPNNLIKAIVDSNHTRKQFIVDLILKQKPSIIGVYRLTMKHESDNFRNSAILDVISMLKEQNAQVVVYEPLLEHHPLPGIENISDLSAFKEQSDLIITNRFDSHLNDVKEKVYSRDIFSRD